MIRALIFDFDGLILDTESPVFQSWEELYQAHDCRMSMEVWSNVLGTTEGSVNLLEELERQLGRRLEDREGASRRRRQRETELIARQEVLPGVADILFKARRLGLKVGLASSSSCDWVTGHLSRLGLLDEFDCILARDDVSRTKPDPELLLSTLASLGINADEAIVFEDSPNGLQAAKRAGIFCVVVPNAVSCQLPLDQADLRLNSLADLPLEKLLEMVNNGHGLGS